MQGRRRYLPSPPPANPLPDPGAVAVARSLEDLSGSSGQLKATIRPLPMAETDRMTQRYHQEAAQTLMTLGACDQPLVHLAEILRQTPEGTDHNWALSNLAEIREGIELVITGVRER